MEIKEISNADVNVIEYGWLEVIIEHDGEEYTLEFDTEEYPNDGFFGKVEFADDDSEELANKIGFVIDENFKSEIYHLFGEYSNDHFR